MYVLPPPQSPGPVPKARRRGVKRESGTKARIQVASKSSMAWARNRRTAALSGLRAWDLGLGSNGSRVQGFRVN